MPTLTTLDAAHLLRRVGFGGTSAEIAALTGVERSVAVDTVMDLSTAPAVVRPDVDNRNSQWQSYVNAYEWWAHRMVTTTKPFQEKMTLFWHGHFCSAQSKLNDMTAMFNQNQLFRTQGLGSFRDLCQAVAIDPAMLVYLDNAENVKGNEQENFGRELVELFTLGVGNYTESDVIALAKAWTGHNVVGWNGSFYDPTYVFKPTKHDTTTKTLFGIAANWDGPQTIDEIVLGSKQAACARFMARKLFRYFAHPNPSDGVVQSLADVFIASGMNVAALVRAVLMHDEFWGASSRYALVKSPTEFVVDVLRRTGLTAASSGLTWSMESMGQVLFNPPNVAGWGQNAYWLSTATAWGRGAWVAGRRWALDDIGFWSTLSSLSPVAGVQKIFDDLGILEPSAATRSQLEQWFTTMKAQDSWAIQYNALILGTLCPEFQLA